MAVAYVLDEDVNPAVAVIGRGLGLDVTSVHDIGRTGFSDDRLFDHVTQLEKVFVTRNRNDFLALTRHYYAIGRSFPGLLIIPHTLPNKRPEAIAHALKAWDSRFGAFGPSPGTVDYLAVATH